MGTSKRVYGGISYEVSGAIAQLTGNWGVTDTRPTKWQLCAKLTAQSPIPIDFVSFPVYRLTNTGLTPQTAELPAGDPSANDLHRTACGIYKLLLGAGPDAREAYCDLTPGRFALGPQVQVQVFATLWSGFSAGPNIDVYSSLGPSDGTGDYLPYTVAFDLAAGATSPAITTPPGAQWCDLGVQNAQITATDYKLRSVGNPMVRDYLTPTFYPAVGTPSAVQTSSMQVINFGALAVGSGPNNGYVKFWCQP